jgi:hypothetical protein
MSCFTAGSAKRETKMEQQFKAIRNADEVPPQHPIPTLPTKRNNDLAIYLATECCKPALEDVVIHRYDVDATEPKSTLLKWLHPPETASLDSKNLLQDENKIARPVPRNSSLVAGCCS